MKLITVLWRSFNNFKKICKSLWHKLYTTLLNTFLCNSLCSCYTCVCVKVSGLVSPSIGLFCKSLHAQVELTICWTIYPDLQNPSNKINEAWRLLSSEINMSNWCAVNPLQGTVYIIHKRPWINWKLNENHKIINNNPTNNRLVSEKILKEDLLYLQPWNYLVNTLMIWTGLENLKPNRASTIFL